MISWKCLEHFCHHFWVSLLLLCYCTHPKVMTKMFKKCSTHQRFIRKRNTTYKIHTLILSKLFIKLIVILIFANLKAYFKILLRKVKEPKKFWEMSNLKLPSWIESFGRNPILQKISPIKSMKKSQWARRLSKTTMWPYFSVTIISETIDEAKAFL